MIKSNFVGIAVLAGSLAATAGCNNNPPKTDTGTTTSGTTGATPAAAGDKSGGGSLTGASSTTELANRVDTSLKGKTIAYLPVSMGVTLMEEWWHEIQVGAASSGMKAEVKDPNWSTTAETQALAALIGEKPDVMVVHNPNVQLLAKQLEQAEKQGSYVIQVNMVSNYKTDAYVGVDWGKLGAMIATDIVKKCGKGSGKSGKVQIIQGELTSAASLDQLAGAKPIYDADPSIKIVSDQAANWDATKAHDITATVLQQNPDLCAIHGFWDVMSLGAAQAIKQAGLSGKIVLDVSGDGARAACDGVASGDFTNYFSYDAQQQGRDIISTAKLLLESGKPPGTEHYALYSPVTVLTKDTIKPSQCFDVDIKK
jgi:ribose transport system substrate-binding protein